MKDGKRKWSFCGFRIFGPKISLQVLSPVSWRFFPWIFPCPTVLFNTVFVGFQMTILRSSLPSGDSVPSEQFKRLLKQLERQRPGPTCWERLLPREVVLVQKFGEKTTWDVWNLINNAISYLPQVVAGVVQDISMSWNTFEWKTERSWSWDDYNYSMSFKSLLKYREFRVKHALGVPRYI